MTTFREFPSSTRAEFPPAARQPGEGPSRGARPSKRLIVVRAGPTSTHRAWYGSADNRQFDVAVSYYGDDEYVPSQGEIVHYFKGGKWEGIFDFFRSHPELASKYSYIWLPDDDLVTDASTINKLFDIAESQKLQICQPSLSWESHYSHFITLQNRKFQIRYTNYVETMAPLFSSSALMRVLPLFEGFRFGWGLDEVWCRLLPDPLYGSAIIDAVSIDHLRPLHSGSLYETNISPKEERVRILSRVGIGPERFNARVYAGIGAKRGFLLKGPLLRYQLYMGWRRLPASSSRMKKLKIAKAVRRCASGRHELPPIQI